MGSDGNEAIDGLVIDFASGLQAERKGAGKILLQFGSMIQDFQVHVIFATDKLIASHPDTIKAFLAGWFESVRYMQSHKAETVAVAHDVQHVDEDIASAAYDQIMPEFSLDGRFEGKRMETLGRSFVELGLLDKAPDMQTLYTDAFLPKPAP